MTTKPAKKASRKATPGGVAEPELVGRRFTKREEFALDSADYFDLNRAKAAAVDILSAAGYEESSLYGPIGECFALERVRVDKHDDDSPEGLAGQVLQYAREIETWLDYYGTDTLAQSAKHVMSYAYRIGRCHAFAKAYGIDSAQAKKTASAPRSGNPIKARAIELMRASKGGGESLKDFIAQWQQGPQDDLRLTLEGDVYVIADEGTTDSSRHCKHSTLVDWWSDAQ